MTRFGFITAEFSGATFDAILDQIIAAGGDAVQLDLASWGGETFPQTLSRDEISDVGRALASRGIEAAALTGCYNMVHPDQTARAQGRRDLIRLIRLARPLGIPIVTLCTGTRSERSIWQAHPDNDAPEAWNDLVVELDALMPCAEAEGVILGIETEVANTINTPAKARRLLDDMGSRHLKIIMDGANLFQKGDLQHMHTVLRSTFDLLGPDIVLAHAKDLDHDGEAGLLPAGRGLLDYDHYMALLAASGFDGAIILHSLRPDEAADRLVFVREKNQSALP